MKKGFIKGEKILELPLDSKASLAVYLDIEHGEYYFDSGLYFFDGKKAHLLVNDSLAFHTGKGLYIRSHSINDYTGSDFENELAECQTSERYNKIGRLFEITECVNYDAYLFKQNGKIRFLLNKLKIESNEKEQRTTVMRKKLYETEVSESNITQWQEILEKEFIPRYITELKKINTNTTDGQIEASLTALRNGGF